MENVIRIVEHIRLVSGAHIDQNYRQGRDAVKTQLQLRSGVEEETLFVDKVIAQAQNDLAQLHIQVAPYHLPEEYAFFLEFYGGLLIETKDYNLIIEGIGPMVEEWYGFIMGDKATYENGFLGFSNLPFKGKRIGDYIKFFIDLAGIVHPNCIIGIKYGSTMGYALSSILQSPHAYPERWIKVADSFMEWLEQVDATQGSMGYGQKEN